MFVSFEMEKMNDLDYRVLFGVNWFLQIKRLSILNEYRYVRRHCELLPIFICFVVLYLYSKIKRFEERKIAENRMKEIAATGPLAIIDENADIRKPLLTAYCDLGFPNKIQDSGLTKNGDDMAQFWMECVSVFMIFDNNLTKLFFDSYDFT